MSKSSKATKSAMEQLHATLATTLANAVGASYKDEDGKDMPPPAAILSVARQFLKDNHIEGAALDSAPISNLASTLPRFDDADGIDPSNPTH